MPQIQLTEKAYANAMRRADKAGFESVDEYVAAVIIYKSAVDKSNELDHRFTPEFIEHLERYYGESCA